MVFGVGRNSNVGLQLLKKNIEVKLFHWNEIRQKSVICKWIVCKWKYHIYSNERKVSNKLGQQCITHAQIQKQNVFLRFSKVTQQHQSWLLRIWSTILTVEGRTVPLSHPRRHVRESTCSFTHVKLNDQNIEAYFHKYTNTFRYWIPHRYPGTSINS